MSVGMRTWPDLDPLLAIAEEVAERWGSAAGRSTTPARERAILRLFGVEGVDRDGEPLAAAVLARALANDPERLARGIALPFAVALLEYDVSPQELALDVAAGAIDLALEAELLADPERRTAAEGLARRLGEAALARIDANRLARRDLRDVLGDGQGTLVGLDLDEPVLEHARSEATRRVAAGADVLRIRVPAIRELVDRLLDAGIEPPAWHPAEDAANVPADLVPAGAQRALSILRRAVDEAASERRRYVRLMTVTSALAAPEQAAVAAFERVDLVQADPFAEIVEGGVDPQRVLVDHVFAHRLHARAGTHLLIGPGPLAVGPDLARGIPSDGATRDGRAFALQLLGVALARRDGLGPSSLLVGTVPAWTVDEQEAAIRALAQSALRRAAFPGAGLAIIEPDTGGEATQRWPYVMLAALVGAGNDNPTVVIRRGRPVDTAAIVSATRLAAAAARHIATGTGASEARGPALERVAATVAAARETLARLAAEGWPGLLELAGPGAPIRQASRASVFERSEEFDPLSGA